MYHPLKTWPKPSPFPICAIILALINAGLFYGLQAADASFYWLTPTITMNIFFFWAEWSIYMREKRNFDGWRQEMEVLLQPSRKNIWEERLRAVQRHKSD